MSRLKDRKKQKSVIEELSTDTDDLSKFERVTYTMRRRDIEKLEDFVKQLNEEDSSEERITKSYVVRKALNLLYKNKSDFR